MVNVKSITARQQDDGAHAFIATLEVNGRPMQIPLAPHEVLSYRAFQEAILSATGQLYIPLACEGRSPEAADQAWHQIVSISLDPLPAEPVEPVAKPKPARTPATVN